jgi:hypothetical protein
MSDPARFVAAFAAYWAAPDIDPLPLVFAGLRRPSGWRQLWTAGGVRALLSARGTPR